MVLSVSRCLRLSPAGLLLLAVFLLPVGRRAAWGGLRWLDVEGPVLRFTVLFMVLGFGLCLLSMGSFEMSSR